MKSATGSTLLLYVIIIVVGIVGAIFIATNNYSKAYKAKNSIIASVDNNYNIYHGNKIIAGVSTYSSGDCFEDNSVRTKCIQGISASLKKMGYFMNSGVNCANLNDGRYDELTYPKSSDKFEGYCIFKNYVNTKSYYYTVITFNHMNVNVLGIGTLYKTNVYGQTRIYFME